MLIDKLKARFAAAIQSSSADRGDETITVGADRAHELLHALRDEPEFAFDFLTDLSAVDWLERNPRFEVVYHLHSLSLNHRLRVKVPVSGGDPSADSVVDLWGAADWLERECFDMFGIHFRNHPDLRRILMYDSFEGHPLRKDYPVTKRQPLVPEIDPVINPRKPSS